jgi:hypothetical protein
VSPVGNKIEGLEKVKINLNPLLVFMVVVVMFSHRMKTHIN